MDCSTAALPEVEKGPLSVDPDSSSCPCFLRPNEPQAQAPQAGKVPQPPTSLLTTITEAGALSQSEVQP